MSLCLSAESQKNSVFRTCSKTTEAINLKFTHNIRVGPKSVLGKFLKSFCLFVYLFVRKKHKNPTFPVCSKTTEAIDLRAEGPFTSPPKEAIYGPKAHLIMGRRPIYKWAEGPYTRGESWADVLAGRRPVHVAAEGGD